MSVVVSAVFATVLGALPHVLHHAGPLAGAAIFAGLGGTLLFGLVGLVAAVPMIVRLHRHCGNWRIPAAALAAMAAAFSLSAFVIGPAIAGDGSDDAAKPAQSAPSGPRETDHEAHHE